MGKGGTRGKVLEAEAALEFVLAAAGASKVRDRVDRALVVEVASWGTEGQLIEDEMAAPVNGPGSVEHGTPWVDGNGDGIPDDVERGFGNAGLG